MEIIYGTWPRNNRDLPLACALGFFDGVHRGHQNLIYALNDISQLHNYKSMVFTFEKHPMSIIDKSKAPKLIMDNRVKSEIFEGLGVDLLNFYPVSSEFLSLKAEDFLQDILLKKYNVKAIIAGFNFRFGFKGQGDSKLLLEFGKKSGVDVTIVNPVYIDGQLVSSTTIRRFIEEGRVEMACEFLGRPFLIEGRVIHGKERGRKMGTPTANLSPDDSLVIPKAGVYITQVEIEGRDAKYMGVTNVGCNPTFGGNKTSIESHIIDFNEDIYDCKIRIKFLKRLRDEIPFNSPDSLTAQIEQDKKAAAAYFNINVYK